MRWLWAHVAQEAEHNLGKIEVPGSSPGVGSRGRCSSAVEQLFRKQQVVGSNPTTGSRENFLMIGQHINGRVAFPIVSILFDYSLAALGNKRSAPDDRGRPLVIGELATNLRTRWPSTSRRGRSAALCHSLRSLDGKMSPMMAVVGGIIALAFCSQCLRKSIRSVPAADLD